MPDRLFKDLDYYSNKLNELMKYPQTNIEGWYKSVEICTKKIGELTPLITTRRTGMFGKPIITLNLGKNCH